MVRAPCEVTSVVEMTLCYTISKIEMVSLDTIINILFGKTTAVLGTSLSTIVSEAELKSSGTT